MSTVDAHKIDGVTLQGDGVIRSAPPVFVHRALPDEVVRYAVYREARKSQFATLGEVLLASPVRIAPGCHHYEACGHCAWLHTSLVNEGALKAREVHRTLARVVATDCEIRDHLPPSREAQRLRVTVEVDQHGGLFWYGPRPDRRKMALTDLQCAIILPQLATAIHQLDSWLRAAVRSDRSAWRWLILRARSGNPVRLRLASLPGSATTLVAARAEQDHRKLLHSAKATPTPEPALAAFALARGPMQLPVQWFGKEIYNDPRYFFQPSLWGLETIARILREHADSNGTLWDLYGGAGVWAMALADRCHNYRVVDNAYPEDVNESENSQGSQWHRDLQDPEACEELAAAITSDDLVILDPPRTGISAELASALAHTRPKQLIYVACDHTTMARDLARLANFRVTALHTVQQFAGSGAIETVAVATPNTLASTS